MTRPSSVIYLPPGVVPPQAVAAPQSVGTGIPFDRQFFERVLGGAVKSFCEQAECGSPIVELLTLDGTRHYVRGISGATDAWVALHTQSEEHEHPIQVFIPYATIFRVEIHPEDDLKQRRLGFIVPESHEVPILLAQEATVASAEPPAKKSRKKS